MTITVAVLGIDHHHSFGMLEGMIEAGCKAKSWWTARPAKTLDGFVKRFSDLPRIDNYSDILNDPEIDMVLIADIPVERAKHAIKAMEAGKDVMVDKPGCTTLEQLAQIKDTVARTNRIWSIDFSERFEVPAVIKAAELIAEGAIGKVVQTIGMGPHRINKHLRDDWFFDPEQYGGILADIGSHQIEKFLFFTGSTTADIVTSTVGNYANPDHPKLEDFGEILLRNENGHAYIRLDWYTPEALPNWGDGSLTILGTEGYIELRKYVDVAGREGTDHLYLVNGTRYEHIDCSDIPLTYFKNLADDVRNSTETSMAQSHAFEVTRLAIAAQIKATRVGNLAK